MDPRLACSITKTKATSKFDVDSTAMAVLRGRDMRGKTALITGANSGIGNFSVFFLNCLRNYFKKIGLSRMALHLIQELKSMP